MAVNLTVVYAGRVYDVVQVVEGRVGYVTEVLAGLALSDHVEVEPTT